MTPCNRHTKVTHNLQKKKKKGAMPTGYARLPVEGDLVMDTHVDMDSDSMLGGLRKEWSVGLCGCFSAGVGLFCSVMWCMPCMLGRLHGAAVGKQENTMDKGVCCGLTSALSAGTALTIGLTRFIPGCIMPQLGCCPTLLYIYWLRSVVRSSYGIEGTLCKDGASALFCPCCAVCQMHTEIYYHGIDPGAVLCSSQPGYTLEEQPGDTLEEQAS
eukprot:TRINITY_DN2928_c1_g1_i3.p1 TRINITY_DN2928_c1_g1~~TRINITY_DN2928_c1_g1_i3.p1  ORF type:complete len:214 (+),score=21.21 TRINITY_DN2928_c1_g1_i3:510-1151(+)